MITKLASTARNALKWVLTPAHAVSLAVSLIPPALTVVFVRFYGNNIVWADQGKLMPVVRAVVRGEFRIGLLFSNLGGQYNLFPAAIAALGAALTGWNIWVEIAANLLVVCVTLMVLVALLRKTHQVIAIYALPVFSLLLFSVHQDVNWLNAFFGHWFYSNLLFLLGLYLVISFPGSWRALITAALLALAATYTSANGVLAWFAIGTIIVFAGFRKWPQVVFWLAGAAGALTIAIFMAKHRVQADVVTPLKLADFALRYLGASFVSRFEEHFGLRRVQTWAFALGLLALIVLFVNLAYLCFKQKDYKSCLIWLPVAAYGGVSGLLIGLARISLGMYEYGPFYTWYATMSNMFWVSYLAVALIVIWKTIHSDSLISLPQVLGVANLAILTGLLTLFILQNQRIALTSYAGDNPDYFYIGIPITDRCARDYVFTLEEECLADFVPYVDEVAAYRLNIFARTDPVNILPNEYQAGQPVIIETERAWHGVHVRDWLLAGVNRDDLIFIFPDDAADPILEGIPEPLTGVVTGSLNGNAQGLRELAGQQEVIWHIRQVDQPSQPSAFVQILIDEGCGVTFDTVHEPGGFHITRYECRRTPNIDD
ncbi:MAG: hypothetical protein Kow00124_30040 [Anaerolineae bacterium]